MKIKRITVSAFILALSVSALTVSAEAKNTKVDASSICLSTSTRNGGFYDMFVQSVVDKLIDMSGLTMYDIGDYNFEINSVYDCFVYLGLDSIDAVDFVMWLEDEYEIQMSLYTFYQHTQSPLGSFCQYLITLLDY